MRLLFKIGGKLVTAAMMAWMVWLCFVPATVAERAGLGADFNQFNLIQMRLARSMLSVAPDLTVTAFSQATDIPPDIMQQHLQGKATGNSLLAPRFDMQELPAAATPEVETPEPTPHRRTEAGGALFVRP